MEEYSRRDTVRRGNKVKFKVCTSTVLELRNLLLGNAVQRESEVIQPSRLMVLGERFG